MRNKSVFFHKTLPSFVIESRFFTLYLIKFDSIIEIPNIGESIDKNIILFRKKNNVSLFSFLFLQPSAFSLGDLHVPQMANVLKVFLENGQTKSFKYDSTTTVRVSTFSLQRTFSIKLLLFQSIIFELDFHLQPVNELILFVGFHVSDIRSIKWFGDSIEFCTFSKRNLNEILECRLYWPSLTKTKTNINFHTWNMLSTFRLHQEERISLCDKILILSIKHCTFSETSCTFELQQSLHHFSFRISLFLML